MNKTILALTALFVAGALAIIFIGGNLKKDAAEKMAIPLSANTTSEKMKTIAHGEEVNLHAHLVPGKVVVFDFYADWCGPCKVLGPQLETLVQEHADVILRKIDIVDWNTPVVKQHGINFVPNVHVYNTQGQRVGNPTSSLSAISDNINKALKK